MEFFHRPLPELRSEYWMIQKLGCGGFGKVYLIRHRASREYCAAKHQKWVTPDTQRTARREAAVLRRLGAGHQNHIVHYIDYFEVSECNGYRTVDHSVIKIREAIGETNVFPI